MVFEAVKSYLPHWNLSGVVSIVGIFILIGLFAIVGTVAIYFFLRALKFNKQIVLFENIAGQGFVPTKKDRAMSVKVGDAGEEVFYLKKHKVYRTAYGKKMGKNTYWFAIGSDGYWYNITLEDLDKKLNSLGVNPVDRDMRYMHVAIRKNLKDRFQKTTFWEKYGGMVAYIGLIAITGIMMYLLFDKYLAIAGANEAASKLNLDVLREMERILGALDSLKGTGALKPA